MQVVWSAPTTSSRVEPCCPLVGAVVTRYPLMPEIQIYQYAVISCCMDYIRPQYKQLKQTHHFFQVILPPSGQQARGSFVKHPEMSFSGGSHATHSIIPIPFETLPNWKSHDMSRKDGSTARERGFQKLSILVLQKSVVQLPSAIVVQEFISNTFRNPMNTNSFFTARNLFGSILLSFPWTFF